MNDTRRPLFLRITLIVLGVCLILLQARLWVSEDGFVGMRRLADRVALQRAENRELAERNERLNAEVRDLKSGFSAVEERARADLGLIAPNETFYLVSDAPGAGESR
jgi:cell division protein FtsB